MNENREMSGPAGPRATEVFLRASELALAARAAFLDDACKGNAGLRAEVEALLLHDLPSALLGRAAAQPVPATIGPYTILSVLGEGGMGIVYVAEQMEPLKRRVALKVIKHGMDTSQVIARFDAERQALSLMNHPNVARVLDSGSDAQGRPYFVMELIKGIPITDYCDRNKLATRQRLELFIQACEGVHHAHQKGILHRDIKPANILVEIQEGKPVPRIIDFGVAKAIDRQLTERALFTEYGQVLGTPEYMSPEQAEMTALDIDTRTDVYSLGVVLYEMLAGALPFDPGELRAAGYDEMRRHIREVTPPKPSTRIHTLGVRSGEIARSRSADPVTLERICRGDLDWITMKALEKDRTRRYGSASELAADLVRHLNDEPVSAGPPNVGYRARKFLRRHRAATAFTTVLALAVLSGLVGTTWGMRRADLQAGTARAVTDFMLNVFETMDPEAKGGTSSPRDVLDRAAQRVRTDLAGDPELQARVMEVIGLMYRSLGDYAQSQPLLEGALAGQTRVHGEESEEAAEVRTKLGGLLIKQGHADAAIPLLEKSLAVEERMLRPDDAELAKTLSNLGNSYRSLRHYDQALPYLERALAIRERVLGPSHPDVGKLLVNLGATRAKLEDHSGAQRDLERAVEIYQKAFGDENVLVAAALNNLAYEYWKTKTLPQARSAVERALDIQEKALGAEHPDLASSLMMYGMVLRAVGDLAGSETALRKSVSIAEKKLGTNHSVYRDAASQLAQTLEAEGKNQEAAALSEKVTGER